ncbi:NUDIX hydrolase [Actomonas aquatica]|uniref:NUDIX domain-containing protein n=1 Tax=Actomonas aquatica TaxID=2866162 RepID=A0ABZ1C5Y3_9BACT|nr:NUDIX domain-containing protein [Opitutus sp. WL0086]WRQ85710.1 NUDIX domain-containing protein [Opitutus sp. WL0086]
MSFTYQYAHPAVTVDAVVFGFDESDLKVLLVQRAGEPHRGSWALPGGFVEMTEDLETAARRELAEETGLSRLFLEQLYTFGAPERDPRERVISVAYYALVKLMDHAVRAASDAKEVAWFPVADLPDLAFDHEEIVNMALKRLKGKIRYEPIGFELLPEKFPLSELQRLYETVLEQPLDKRNFRKKIQGMGLLQDTHEIQQDVAHRAARLYRFDQAAYQALRKRGFNFEL